MKKEAPVIIIAGGDKRNIYLREMLFAEGYEVHSIGLPESDLCIEQLATALAQADVVVLPISGIGDTVAVMEGLRFPATFVFEHVNPQALLIGGSSKIGKDRPRCFDLNTMEAFAAANARATAEGAVAIAMEKGERTLRGRRCLISGYGRIAQALENLLQAFGAKVTVACRKEHLFAQIRSHGSEAVSIAHLEEQLQSNELFFNTVPALLIEDECLQKIAPNCAVILELASPPHCCNIPLAAELGIDAAVYSGIPGKLFPRSAGEYIFVQIQRLLKEGGMI